MSRPAYRTVNQGGSTWHTDINYNFKTILEGGPLPVRQYSTKAELPAPEQQEGSIAVFFDSGVTNKFLIALSDGTAWRIVGQQAAFQANSNAVTIAQLVADFNSLLSKLRSSGIMALS